MWKTTIKKPFGRYKERKRFQVERERKGERNSVCGWV